MWSIIRRIVEVPLTTSQGVVLGRVQIDKKGRLRIQMKRWMKPGDFTQVITFLQNLNADMNNHAYIPRQIDNPARVRRGRLI